MSFDVSSVKNFEFTQPKGSLISRDPSTYPDVAWKLDGEFGVIREMRFEQRLKAIYDGR